MTPSQPDSGSAVQERLEIIDTRLEHLSAITLRMAETSEANMLQIGRLPENINALGIKVDALTNKVDTFDDKMNAIGDKLDAVGAKLNAIGDRMESLRDLVTNGLVEVRLTAERQNESIARMAEAQELTVSRLVATVDRQAQMVEHLLQGRG